MRLLWAVLLLGLSATAAAESRSDGVLAARHAIEQCRRQPLASLPRGIESVRRLCPQIDRAVAQLGLSALLDEHWQERLDDHGLQDLLALTARYTGTAAAAAATLDPARLVSIAHGLSPALPVRQPWWESVKSWLRRLLGLDQPSATAPWSRLWQSVPGQRLGRWMAYLLMAGVLVLTGIIVGRELKAAGVIGLAKDARTRPAAAPAVPGLDGDVELADIEAATGSRRPRLLLQWLVQALTRSRRLETPRSLTHRELARHAIFDSAAQRDRFTQIALLAERALYGPEDAPAQIDALIDTASRLQAELATPAVRQ